MLTDEGVIKLSQECGAVISRTLSDGAQTRIEFTTEQLCTYTDVVTLYGKPTIIKEKVRAECTTREAVGYLKFTSNTDVVFTQNDETRLVLAGASPVITNCPNMPVYLAPPNYQALEDENKELVECVNKLRDTLEDIDSKALAGLCYFTLVSAREFHKDIRRACEEALEIPLPAAMKGE